MAPSETENNAYAKFRGVEQRTLWYVMVFSGVVNCCLVYLSVHMCDATWRYYIQDVLDGLGWYIFSILPLGS